MLNSFKKLIAPVSIALLLTLIYNRLSFLNSYSCILWSGTDEYGRDTGGSLLCNSLGIQLESFSGELTPEFIASHFAIFALSAIISYFFFKKK